MFLFALCDSEAETTELQSVSHRNSAGPKTLVSLYYLHDLFDFIESASDFINLLQKYLKHSVINNSIFSLYVHVTALQN